MQTIQVFQLLNSRRNRSVLALLISTSVVATSALISWYSVNKQPEIVVSPTESCSTDWLVNGTDNTEVSFIQANLFINNENSVACKPGIYQQVLNAQVSFYVAKLYELRAKKGTACNKGTVLDCLESFAENVKKEWANAKSPASQAVAVFKAQALLMAANSILSNTPVTSPPVDSSQYTLPQSLDRYFMDYRQSNSVDKQITDNKETESFNLK